jgi:hypothetical protein
LRGTLDEKVAAYQAYRSAAEPGSADWLTGTRLLIYVLVKEGRDQQAIDVTQEIIARHLDTPAEWLNLAQRQHALGLDAKAKASFAEAERRIKSESKETSERPNRKKAGRPLYGGLEETRAALGIEKP